MIARIFRSPDLQILFPCKTQESRSWKPHIPTSRVSSHSSTQDLKWQPPCCYLRGPDIPCQSLDPQPPPLPLSRLGVLSPWQSQAARKQGTQEVPIIISTHQCAGAWDASTASASASISSSACSRTPCAAR